MTNYQQGQHPVTWSQQTEPIAPPGHPTGWVAPPARKNGLPGWAVFLIVIGGLLFCGALGSVGLAAVSDPPQERALVVTETSSPAGPKVAKPSPAATTAPAKPKPAAPKIGTTFRAGDFQYTVHSKKCGMSTVGGPYLKTRAQGSFCRLDVTAKNVTRSAHYFDSDSTITVTDTKGRKFSADSTANIYGNEDGAGWFEEINPGNKVRAFVYFDVSGGVRLASATFSAGVLTTAKDVTVRF